MSPVKRESPPVHGVIPAERERRSPQDQIGNNRITHHVPRMPSEGEVVEREALLPYAQLGADGVTTVRRRPRQLTHEENFTIVARVSENVRKRADCVEQRKEARSPWARLRYPTPEDPFDPTDGFSEDAVRLATLGCTYLELAEVMGNSAARQHLHREMIRQRGIRNDPFFMGHWEEYREACSSNQRLLRDFYPTEERR